MLEAVLLAAALIIYTICNRRRPGLLSGSQKWNSILPGQSRQRLSNVHCV